MLPLGPVAAGLTGAFGDEVVHGIFGGGTGPSGGRRAGAGARALQGGIGFRTVVLCGGAVRRFPGRTTYPGRRYGYGPSLLPSTEVYSVLRDNGFSPLGIPRLRGFVYTIAAIDRGGADGRLIIDARNGRIIRFLPAYRMGGDNYYEEQSALRGPFGAQPPQAPGAGPCPGRAAAVTASSSCREPHGADAEGQSARRQTAPPRRSSRRQRLRRSRPRCRQPPR